MIFDYTLNMKVVDFSKQLGIPSTKIRYYDKIGLIQGNRDKENNYRNYDRVDALNLYHSLMLRSFGMSIDQCKLSKEKELEEINTWTDQYIETLEKEIIYRKMMQQRLKEMQIYYQMMQDTHSSFLPLNLDDQYIVWNIGDNLQFNETIYQSIELLANKMPYSFIAIKITKESILRHSNQTLDVVTGLGILKHNVKNINLDLPYYETYKGGKTIQFVFETSDPYHLQRNDIQPLLNYLNQHNLPVQDIVGRIVLSYQHEGYFKHGILVTVEWK